jgi:hypothetical protein
MKEAQVDQSGLAAKSATSTRRMPTAWEGTNPADSNSLAAEPAFAASIAAIATDLATAGPP